MKKLFYLFALLFVAGNPMISLAQDSEDYTTAEGVVPVASTANGTQYGYYLRSVAEPTTFFGLNGGLGMITSSAPAMVSIESSDNGFIIYVLEDNARTGNKLQASGAPKLWATSSNSNYGSTIYEWTIDPLESDATIFNLYYYSSESNALYARSTDCVQSTAAQSLYATLDRTDTKFQWEFIPANDAAKNADPLDSEIDEAEAVLSIRGVGYPTTESDAYTTLQNAIAAAKQIREAGSSTSTDITTLQNAVSEYKSATTGIQMPENGKAYTFTTVLKNGNKRPMYYDASASTYYMATATTSPTYSTTNVLVCRDLGEGKYAFVNNAGYFFIWRGGGNFASGNNSNKGFMTTYDETYCSITIEKLTADGHSNVDATQDELFGYMTYIGQRNTTSDNTAYFVGASTSYFGGTEPYYTDTYSSAVLIEEYDYPNVVTLNSTNGTISGANYLGTFSAPFATLIPDNVSAYYVGSTTDSSDETALATAVMTQIETAIPANTGVILASDTETSATMVPVTSETVTTIDSDANLLGNSAGEDLTIGDNYYILSSTADYGVGFYLATSGTTLSMNKSYLNYSGTSAAIALNFDGKSTDITNATSNVSDNAPVYDLSGRRVQNTVKGGLYISNGKKFIVK